MSKTVVYTLRNGNHEYRVPKERFEKMKARMGSGAFNVIREEDGKQSRTPDAPAKVEKVSAAPGSPAKAEMPAKLAAKKTARASKQAKPKEVRTPGKAKVTPAPTDERKDQSPE